MLPLLSALATRRWFIRWPVKLGLFGAVVLATLYPSPRLLSRHLRHIRSNDQLTEPGQAALTAIRDEFLQYAHEHEFDTARPDSLLRAVERFVYARIPYAWDWDTWGVADYLPTVPELLEKGREDCDGRAVLAAALLRSFGVDARLVADPRHVWVRTSSGDLMKPLGQPVFQAGEQGIEVHWAALLDPGPLAFGVAVFPLLRELIILLAAWLLLLPPRMNRSAAALVLLLLVDSLVLVRLAGADPTAPRYLGLAWAAAHWPVAAWLLVRQRATAPVPAVAAQPPG